MVMRAINLQFQGPTVVKIRDVGVLNTQMYVQQEKELQKLGSFIQFDILV